MSMPVEEAIRILANNLVASALTADVVHKTDWEDYPEVGEHDWAKVVERAEAVVAGIRPTPEALEVAYDVLAGRAGGVR